ncbi:MAG: glutaminyl-peptide cyclotransferase [Variibacter sp.]|nr:glutaminyl-peptide cyclotransferase [Variibacter sp.]
MSQARAWAIAVAASLALGSASAREARAECAPPASLRFEIADTIRRDKLGLTQGLEFRDGKLYESTGRIDGTTQVNVIDLQGRVTTLVELGTKVFGEGLTILDDEIVQLTWQEHLVFVYDLSGRLKRTMHNPRLGWGLSNDGRQLLFSDGAGAIYFADPKTFAIARSVPVRSVEREGVPGLNELEMVDGRLYGNIFQTRQIVRLDPSSGCIEATADLSPLWAAMDEPERRRIDGNLQYVLNGIAYDPRTQLFYLTGKRWRYIFAGRFVPATR